MTVDGLRTFGLAVTTDGYREYCVPAGSGFRACDYRVEGDASGASYKRGLAAVTGGEIRVHNINPKSAQGDVRFPELLARMGCAVRSCERGAEGGWIAVKGAPLRALDADMTLMPDTAQTLAVIAAFARGTSRLAGLSTLRIKETDRIAALAAELGKCGIASSPEPDALAVTGGAPRAAEIDTYEDHRMAMSFALIGARVPGIVLKNAGVVEKSFPAFWDTLAGIGIGVRRIER
jgi:3-phosphoshikimate 1-carboxyvinyltransferase